ncbi:MAG: hypothetical protein R3A48_00720 [Polyangiales bacterium]
MSPRAALSAALLAGCVAAGEVEFAPAGDDDAALPADAVSADRVAHDDVARLDPRDGSAPPADVPSAPIDRPAEASDVPRRGGYCAPCATNDDCASGGLCVRSPMGEMLCAVPCGAGGACDADRRCVGVQTNAGVFPQCVPLSGTCRGVVMDAGATVDARPAADLGAPTDLPAGTLAPGQRVLRVGDRQVLLYVPTRWRAGASGLVALHGNGDTAANFLATSGLQGVADAEGVALALPLALAGSGPMGVDWDAYTRPASANRDLRLVSDARALLVAGGVDRRRVFLAGQSQGGYLAFYAGMAFAGDFGAVNVTAAGDPMPGLGLAGMAPRRIPVDLLTGDGDFALANIRRTRDDLRARGFDLRYTELPGVGHCCPLSVRTGQAAGVWSWLSARPLP